MVESGGLSSSFSMASRRYLPGLTMPEGHQPSDLTNPDDPKEVENAYVEVSHCQNHCCMSSAVAVEDAVQTQA